MEDDIIDAYLEKRRREALAAEIIQEMQTPSRNLHRTHIDSEDVEAVAMAIERCTPDQVALWIKTLLDWACDDNVWDDAWNDDPQNEDDP